MCREMNEEILRKTINEYPTPLFWFDADELRKRAVALTEKYPLYR